MAMESLLSYRPVHTRSGATQLPLLQEMQAVSDSVRFLHPSVVAEKLLKNVQGLHNR
jgi:hypothetical protein